MDEQERIRIRQLMEQYLQGEDNPEARERFDAWFYSMQPDANAGLSKEELDQTMQRMHARLHKQRFTIQRGRIRRIAAVAASVIVIIGVSSAFKKNSFLFNVLHPAKEMQIATLKGESKIIKLTDGTSIHLNENSAVTYTDRNEREIMLQGEAFFEVTKDEAHPFIVTAGKAAVKVLGTSFNVSVDKKDVVVAVKDGLVALQSDEKQVLLPAGSMGILNSNGTPVLYAHANISNYLSWMNGNLAFDNVALNDVVQELTNIYHVPVQLQDTSLGKIHLTLQYKHVPLSVILNVICNSLDLQYTDQHGTIIIQSDLQD